MRGVTSKPLDFIASPSRILPIPRRLEPKEISQKSSYGPVFSTGPLVPALVIDRPSRNVRTPYVADVMLADGALALAHVPSLDTGGMVVPGSTVLLKKEDDGGKKTCAYSAWCSLEARIKYKESGEEDSDALRIEGDEVDWMVVGCHPQSAEKAVAEILDKNMLPWFEGFHQIHQQVTVGNSRFDYALSNDEEEVLWMIETKVVVCADYPEGFVPKDPLRHPVGVYESSTTPYKRCAIFPHGAQKPKTKVVSERAIKHIHELSTLISTIKEDSISTKAGKITKKTKMAILFVVNRDDCNQFRPCHEADPLFARVLYEAKHSYGVEIYAVKLFWCPASGRAWLSNDQIEVIWDESLKTPLENEKEWLETVLSSAVGPNPRSNTKSKAANTKRKRKPSRRKTKESDSEESDSN
jgi:DNA-binding sugar fermentation-stimulating protein